MFTMDPTTARYQGHSRDRCGLCHSSSNALVVAATVIVTPAVVATAIVVHVHVDIPVGVYVHVFVGVDVGIGVVIYVRVGVAIVVCICAAIIGAAPVDAGSSAATG